MKKEFVEAEAEVIKFQMEDIITTSVVEENEELDKPIDGDINL